MKQQYGHYWLAAVSTGYASPSDWVAWADAIILSSERPASWIIDLSLAKDYAEAMRVIKKQVAIEDDEAKRIVPVEDAQIGFYYLRFKSGRLSLNEVVELISQVAETGMSSLSPEKAYSMLNPSADKRNQLNDGRAQLALVETTIASFGQTAASQWKALTSRGQTADTDL